ncbi:hypothetical protein HPB51_004256 [Rhipicephalus microplus]|uniref:Uncharacterized protein n=1 Tax=Rhipicephalus microplus TaxID=6941 RepID=A0A9J6EQV0_RHIMP|nr:hypothetical protein HPB51_004256 [Rhipicephalus microplus]
MACAEMGPLKTLDELLNFKEPLILCSVEPLRDVKRGLPCDPKILFCHDMMGGYHEDRRVPYWTELRFRSSTDVLITLRKLVNRFDVHLRTHYPNQMQIFAQTLVTNKT